MIHADNIIRRRRLPWGSSSSTRRSGPTLPITLFLRSSPNPFVGRTSLSLALPESGHATVHIYDEAGRLVRTVMDESRRAGPAAVDWDGRDDDGARAAAVRKRAGGPAGSISTLGLAAWGFAPAQVPAHQKKTPTVADPGQKRSASERVQPPGRSEDCQVPRGDLRTRIQGRHRPAAP
jgi:hypothetical protein